MTTISPAAASKPTAPAPFSRLITTQASSGTAAYHTLSGPSVWQQITPTAHFSLIYSTSTAKPEMSRDADIDSHEKLLDSGTLGLVNKGPDGAGSVCRAVEFAPRVKGEDGEEDKVFMHRTESLDYGIVVNGEIELLLPSQPSRLMKVGDVAVQRGTTHGWRNASTTEPARMIFVLLAAEKLKVENVESGMAELGEELPDHAGKTKEALKAVRV